MENLVVRIWNNEIISGVFLDGKDLVPLPKKVVNFGVRITVEFFFNNYSPKVETDLWILEKKTACNEELRTGTLEILFWVKLRRTRI